MSNFYEAPFEKDGMSFFCNEQVQVLHLSLSLFLLSFKLIFYRLKYIMWSKAKLFGDYVTSETIIQSTSQRDIKRLGRGVKDFVDEIWAENRERIAFECNLAKFSQVTAIQVVSLYALV